MGVEALWYWLACFHKLWFAECGYATFGSKVSKEIPIVFVDTGYLFPATYSYRLTPAGKVGF